MNEKHKNDHKWLIMLIGLVERESHNTDYNDGGSLAMIHFLVVVMIMLMMVAVVVAEFAVLIVFVFFDVVVIVAVCHY